MSVNDMSDCLNLPYMGVRIEEVKRGDFIQRNCAPDAQVLDADFNGSPCILTLEEANGDITPSPHLRGEIVMIRSRKISSH